MKILKRISIIILVVLIILLSNISYATNAIMNTLTNEQTSKFTEKAITELYNNTDNENDIMPINDEFEISSNYIDSDIIECNENVSIEKEINGNVYVIGETVNISSAYLNGNIFVIGEDVTIQGDIMGSIYVIGENITIGTSSVNSVYALGKKLTVSENSNIVNDLDVLLKELSIKGNINRCLNAEIANIDIAPTAEYIAKGNVTYTEECTGKTELLENVNLVKEEKNENDIVIDKIKSEITNAISSAIIIAILYFIIRNNESEKMEDYAKTIGNGILKGLLFIIVIPIVAILFVCTIFGIPLAILLITTYIILIYISTDVASLKIAELIYDKKPTSNRAIVILYAICVYIIIRLVALVPGIGGFINLLVVLYGFGILMNVICENKKSTPKEESVIKEE